MTWNEDHINLGPGDKKTLSDLRYILEGCRGQDGRYNLPIKLGLLRRIADMFETVGMKRIDTGEWHSILDALSMGPESTSTDVIEKVTILQTQLTNARHTH